MALTDLIASNGLRPQGIAAVITRAPASADDTLDVSWITLTGEAAGEQSVRWASRGALPAKGDDALLIMDSRGDPWAVCWPSAVTADVPGSLAALSARVDALEATRTVRGIVDATSGTPSILAGSGFTVTDNSIGDYTLNFSPAFSAVPAVIVTARSAAGGVSIPRAILHPAAPVTAAAARIEARRDDTFATIDISFHFIARGPA